MSVPFATGKYKLNAGSNPNQSYLSHINGPGYPITVDLAPQANGEIWFITRISGDYYTLQAWSNGITKDVFAKLGGPPKNSLTPELAAQYEEVVITSAGFNKDNKPIARIQSTYSPLFLGVAQNSKEPTLAPANGSVDQLWILELA